MDLTNNDSVLVLPNKTLLVVKKQVEDGALFQNIISVLNIYVTPLIIAVGVLGNGLSFWVFVKTYLNRQSSSVYLAYLSIADGGFLLALFVVWLGWVNIHTFHTPGWCQIILYFTYVFSFMSVWTVVSFTTERYIVVFYPLKRHVLCTKRRAVGAMLCLTVTSLLVYSFVPWTSSVLQINASSICAPMPQYKVLIKVFSSLDTVITLIVPSLIIIYMNSRIGLRIYNYTRTKQQEDISVHSPSFSEGLMISRLKTGDIHSSNLVVIADTQSQCRACSLKQSRLTTRKAHSQMRITISLFIVSSVFIVLNLPSHAFRVYAFAISLNNQAYKVSNVASSIQEFLQFLYYLSFAANFFLYNAFSRNFRTALVYLSKRTRNNLGKTLHYVFKRAGSQG